MLRLVLAVYRQFQCVDILAYFALNVSQYCL
jgi:hypothetical protein